jgi:CRP-like cAMP-binding protein
MAHEQVLAGTDFFADAPASMLSLIAASGKVKNLVRGDVLFESGDDPDSIYVVLSGRIAIAIGNKPLDNRETVIALMDEGDLFGEMGMLDEAQMTALAAARGAAFDTLYLEGMIQHHLSAIDMAQTILGSANSEAKKLGSSVVTSQTAEVALMKKMLGR